MSAVNYCRWHPRCTYCIRQIRLLNQQVPWHSTSQRQYVLTVKCRWLNTSKWTNVFLVRRGVLIFAYWLITADVLLFNTFFSAFIDHFYMSALYVGMHSFVVYWLTMRHMHTASFACSWWIVFCAVMLLSATNTVTLFNVFI